MNGEFAQYMNWGTNELGMYNPDNRRRLGPKGYFETQNCLVSNHNVLGSWDDEWCSRYHPAACQIHQCDGPCDTSVLCPDGFTDLSPHSEEIEFGNCFTLLSESSYESAKLLCEGLGAQMARVGNETVNDKLALFVLQSRVKKYHQLLE